MKSNHQVIWRTLLCKAILALALAILTRSQLLAQEDSTALQTLRDNAVALKALMKSTVAMQFLDAVNDLPEISPRHFLYSKQRRELIDSTEFASLSDSVRGMFEPRSFGSHFYYNTRYGTPLAFVRALDLTCQQGVTSVDHSSIIDFGFGSIGQLRLLASLGATSFGIEVDNTLAKLYGTAGDTGSISRSKNAGTGDNGSVHLLYGSFPSDTLITAKLRGSHDIFISKNTLKRGYIHPEREVDPRMLVNLGVNDTVFVKTVYDLLKPGGYFMIYNLHPARSKPDEKYIPWSDGRSPFEKTLFEEIGFTVIAFDVDDTPFAHDMARALGWDKEMDLTKDLFGMYTLVKKPN